MIVLDTNIISEFVKPEPAKAVFDWLDQQAAQKLVITSITVAELSFGIHAMPNSKRKEQLKRQVFALLDQEFSNAVLDFDAASAERYGELAASLKAQGRVIGQSDTMIAAIVAEHQATLLTRNDKHFKHCGIEVVNPF